jgi:hypothetical protein
MLLEREVKFPSTMCIIFPKLTSKTREQQLVPNSFDAARDPEPCISKHLLSLELRRSGLRYHECVDVPSQIVGLP